MSRKVLKLVIVGDVHGAWDVRDEEYYSALECDLFLWTGDLIDHPRQGAEIVSSLCRVRRPKNLGILGNNDGATIPLVIAEALGLSALTRWLGRDHLRYVSQYKQIMGAKDIGLARQDYADLQLSVIGLRPFSCGGSRVTFRKSLQELYGPHQHEDYIHKLIDEAQFTDLIMMGHNGPAGLGDAPDAPFGRDLLSMGGDLGDPDYARAIEYAQTKGKRILLAVGGHMHDRLFRSHKLRQSHGVLGGVFVLNACTVSRYREEFRYHMEVTIGAHGQMQSLERVAWSLAGDGHRTSLI